MFAWSRLALINPGTKQHRRLTREWIESSSNQRATIFVRKLWMKLNQPMENRQLSSFFGRCLFVGLGLGTGIAIGIYIAKKLSQIDRTGEIVLALNDVSHEIKELRSSVLMHLEKTTLIDRSRKLYRQVSNHEVTTAISDYLPADEADESSSEEDFFDLQDDELISNKQSLQDNNLLDLETLIQECDSLAEKEEIADNDKELRILEDLLTRNSNNVEVLWRFGRALKRKAYFYTELEDQDEKKNITYKGMQFLDKALEVDANHGDVHKWYAILLGITAEYEPLKNKIPLGHKYKQHILKAVELKPDDPTVFYLMGRWSFEISMLSWWQRQAAATFVAELPTSSFDEALSYFLKAEDQNPGDHKSNALFIGKCYQQLGYADKTEEWIKKSLDIPVKDSEDKKAHEEATTILVSL